MTYDEFMTSVTNDKPSPEASPYLEALWHDSKGDWHKAHQIVQDIHTWEESWIHAYLHRVEGDEGNAGYWYHRAGKPFSKLSLEEEWEEQVRYFAE